MKYFGRVRGSLEQAQPLIVGVDTVYEHWNIEKVPDSEEYEYDENQYEKDEYIKLVSDKTSTLEKADKDNKMAILEIYESMLV